MLFTLSCLVNCLVVLLIIPRPSYACVYTKLTSYYRSRQREIGDIKEKKTAAEIQISQQTESYHGVCKGPIPHPTGSFSSVIHLGLRSLDPRPKVVPSRKKPR